MVRTNFKEIKLTEDQITAIRTNYPDKETHPAFRDMLLSTCGIMPTFKNAEEMKEMTVWTRKMLKEIYGEE